ncbi:MAG: lysophospholipid acyltransferase family protein [Planctomycetes bacterium]|nr:lysophospholipid acyltransferase family protein [Planctomycetota bacterium]
MDPRALRQQRRAQVAAAAAARDAAGRNAPQLARRRRWRRRVGAWLLTLLGPWLVRALAATWRVQQRGPGFALLRSDRPWLVAMWHGGMLALMPLRHHRRRRIGVLVSPSDDGSLALQALASFGYRVVRGSLSRGGAEALRTMQHWLQDGGQLVLTPDGPRGPRCTMNSGVAWLARGSGAPILPVSITVDRAWRLRSWDRFMIPKPFARVVVDYLEPVPVPTTTDDATLEPIGGEVRRALLQQHRAAAAELGTPADEPAADADAERC